MNRRSESVTVKIRKAVITAAGRGTRFLPLTKSQPKEMLPLVNKPLIQFSVEDAIGCGVELVVIVTALGKRAIEDYFNHSFELENMLQHPIYAYEFEGERYDVGTPLGWLETTVAMALKNPELGPGLRDYIQGLLQ